MKQRSPAWIALQFVMLTVSAGIGQTASSPAASAPHPVISFGFGPAGSTIATSRNAPFSAVVVQSFQQTLNDGTNISRENQEIVMRDSAGRIYRGRELKRPFTDRGPFTFFSVTDPVKHVQFRCIAASKHCTIMQYREPPNRTRFQDRSRVKDVTFEELGDSNINGVEVVGERITRLIPEGLAGNDRPFESTEEVWYSKELGLDVEIKRTDPRFGVRKTTLTQLDLAEPDPQLFQIPQGYKVDQLHHSVGALTPLPQSGLAAIPPIAPGIQ